MWFRLWPLPFTLIALVLAALIRLGGGHWRRVDGILEAGGGPSPWLLRVMSPFLKIDGIAIGRVVLLRSTTVDERLRRHEHAHVRQWQRWGILFPLAYAWASLSALVRGGDIYLDNRFEVEARAAELVIDTCTDVKREF